MMMEQLKRKGTAKTLNQTYLKDFFEAFCKENIDGIINNIILDICENVAMNLVDHVNSDARL